MGKAFTGMVAIVDRCKQSARVKHSPVGILVIVIEHLLRKIGIIAADLVEP